MQSEYDKFAEHFDKTRKIAWKDVIDYFADLPESATILDVGCGNGRHIEAAKNEGLKPIGLDRSKKLAKIARKKTGAPIVIGDALCLPFKPFFFENALCIAVVHHFKEEEKRIACLKEIARITQKDFLVSVWAFEQEKFRGKKSQDIQLGWDKKFARFYHLFRDGELGALAEKARLNAKKIWREGGNYWGVF